ncbi:hypothetical protein [Thalassoglobus polymorphus]|uniref:Uncharacterized protein n=1 Tax=Thalassoglobus polymorphus TaxID=2527994 RepID=A0A517QNY2_9PLAN|nr:hypothetical protein [Thalassoglobus polymorphus]QDT33304.1 hypothetical protein Mal48_25570 [Thalassoglobus polymorphus]
MGLLKKLFGSKPVQPRRIDLRPAHERESERAVQSDLGGEDEQLAQRLCQLMRSGDHATARQIGEQINANGGKPRMVRICLRVKVLGGDARTLERTVWNGVGDWRG